MPVLHAFVNPQADGPDPTVVRPSDWNASHLINVVNADVDPAAGIAESKLALNFPTHAAVTIGAPANGLSILGQVVSLGLASALTTGALSSADWSTFNSKQAALTFPLAPNLGGTGVANAVGSTLTLGGATTISTGGTIALGGFTLTVPATGTVDLLGVAQTISATKTFTDLQIMSVSKTSVASFTGFASTVSNTATGSVAAYEILARGINNTIQNITGLSMQAEVFADTANARAQTQLTGFQGRVNIRARAGFTALADLAVAVSANPPFFFGSGGTETITTTRGVNIFNQGAAGVTNAYGLYILSQSGATTLNYAIFTNAGLNQLGDQLSIVGSADRNQLIVTGFSTQTLPVVHFIDATGTTNAIREVQRLEARVSTAATGGANGLGTGLGMYAETATNGTNQPQGLIAAYWVDATNATRKATLALSAYDTAERKGIEIRANGTSPDDVLLGDTWWEGEGFGLPYASFYGNDIAWTQAAAVQNTWYEVSDADIVDGQLNLITHDGSGKLTVAKGGRYRIDYHLVAECSVANKQIQSGLSVSGTEQNDGIDHEVALGINQQMHMGSTAILDLAAGATLEISMRTTDAGTPDITVEHINLSMVMVGGT